MINIKERILKEANHIISTRETIRETAEKFKISKSTIHKDLQERLLLINADLHKQVNRIFNEHNIYKHLKGGQSTKEKYLRK